MQAANSGVGIKNVVASNVILIAALAVEQVDDLFIEHSALLQTETESLGLVLHATTSPADF